MAPANPSTSHTHRPWKTGDGLVRQSQLDVTLKPDDQLARESAAQGCRGAIYAAIVLAQQAGALDLCARLYALHSEALAFERVIRDGASAR